MGIGIKKNETDKKRTKPCTCILNDQYEVWRSLSGTSLLQGRSSSHLITSPFQSSSPIPGSTFVLFMDLVILNNIVLP